MKRGTCPNCGGATTPMIVLSTISYVNYFECELCKSVSLAPKDGSSPAVLELMQPYRSLDPVRLRH